MDNIRIEGGDLSTLLSEIGSKTEALVQISSEQTAKKTAANVARDLRSSSPSSPSGGRYRKGWKSKKLDHGEYVVYNSSVPGFTQLLEFGHDVIRNGVKVGHASAHPHIKDAEDKGIKEFEQEVIKEVERRLSEI